MITFIFTISDAYICILSIYWNNVVKCLVLHVSVIFVNENENENGEKRENNEFVNYN